MSEIIDILEDLSEDIYADVEEALLCLEDIEDEWHRGEEIDTSSISVMREDLNNALKEADLLRDKFITIRYAIMELNRKL